MKKVLIITYYWPPASSPGVFRFLKMAKYLREFGWEPVILTVSNGSYPSVDASLEKDIPHGIKVYKARTIEPFEIYNKITGKKGKAVPVGIVAEKGNQSLVKRLIFHIRANWFIPDARKGWVGFAFRKAGKIIREEAIDAIITTGPPHSTHLIGLKLKKKVNIPWIADYRDPWVNIYYNKTFPRTASTQQKDQALEDAVTASADLVTVVSNGLKNEFEARAKTIELIYNGFDEIDIYEKITAQTDVFRLSYIGNFKPTQNVEIIWKVLSRLKAEIKNFSDTFVLSFTGNTHDAVWKDVEKYGLQDVVKINSFVTHSEAVRLMSESNALLFVIPLSDNNENIITGKLFEYLASRTPIIAIGPVKGDAAAIIAQAGRKPMRSYTDIEMLTRDVLEEYNLWLNNNKTGRAEPEIDISRYSRRGLTEIISNHLNQLVKNK